jgi:hypothetical protein
MRVQNLSGSPNPIENGCDRATVIAFVLMIVLFIAA